MWERCARQLGKFKSIRFAKEKYHSCPKVSHFVYDFPSACCWVGLKSFRHLAVEFFNKGVGFCWRAYKNLGTSFTCANLVMGPFTNITGITTLLTAFDERGIMYLAANNAGWLPYLIDEGVRFVHYYANRVRRQFGLDQDIPNDFTIILESTTFVRPFLQPSAFEFWSRLFIAITILGLQREDLCTFAMHGY